MADTQANDQAVSRASAVARGFVEQAAAHPSGLKVAGWAIIRESGEAPEWFTIEWSGQTMRAEASRKRPDVARTMNVPESLCGFETIVPVLLDARAEWPNIVVSAHWRDSAPYTVPHLKVATEGFAWARKQFAYYKELEAPGENPKPDTAELTLQESAKYREMYNHTGYKANAGSPREAKDFLARYKLSPGDVLIDFGSGPGFASNYFHEEGLRVIAIDIAPNALRDEFLGKFPLIVSAFWDLPAKLSAKWGFCTDVMEHIPPAQIDEVLSVMSSSVSESVFFNISLRPDGCGVVIDQVLHLSVFPREWWEAKLLQFWNSCVFVRGSENENACFVVTGPRRAG